MNTPLRTNARWIVVGAVLLALIQFCAPNNANAQAMSDYSSTPPFIADTVPPNVLLLMDNSGSMNSAAYHNNNEAYNPSKDYNGYFSPTKCYSYGSKKLPSQGTPLLQGFPVEALSPPAVNLLEP